jgi:hypothetical protein
MPLKKQNKVKVKKVIKGLNKAVKAHAGQAKSLKKVVGLSAGGSTVNKSKNYTNPGMRKSLFNSIKASGSGGNPGQWSARKAQMLAKQYKAKGGGYKT